MQGVAMNNRGDVVGNAAGPEDSNARARIWRPGHVPVPLGGIRGGIYSLAMDINDRGTVLGSAVTPEGDAAMFVWRRDRITDLGTLGGRNTGYGISGLYVGADQLNARGDAVGFSQTAAGADHAFLWSDGRMIDLGTLGGTNSYAWGVNDRGDVVGASETADGRRSAFLWQDGVMIDLGALTGSPGGGYASAINNRGQVIGRNGEGRVVLWETRRGG
jgi:probable HAF family extracellular repeat protein